MNGFRPSSSFRPQRHALALEPRLLFDGAMAAAVDHQQNHDSTDNQNTDHHPTSGEPTSTNTASASKHLLVLDSRLENREQLLQGLGSNVTALVVENNQDGLAAISAALAQMGQADSVQILSHGSAGQFSLGNQVFTAGNLEQFGQTLQGWQAHLSQGADIQLYGCDVGAGDNGQRLVSEMARLTGADVAASSNDTGASAKGGDWVLEVRSGDIDKQLALNATVVSSFNTLLADPSVAIAHGVVSASNGTVLGTLGNWARPGSTGAPFSGSITDLLAVEGRASDIDGADMLRLATALKNSGANGAYDISTRVTLPTGLSFVGGSLANANLRVYLGNGTQLVAGVDYSVSGTRITFLDANGQPTLLGGGSGTANDISGANLAIITYDVTVAADIDAGRTLRSSAYLTNYASTDGGLDLTPTDLRDNADQQIAAPSVISAYAGGSLDEADSSAPHTTGSDLVVGERMLYDIVVTLPEGNTQGLQIIGDVPAGMRVDLNFNGGLGYQLITTRAQSAALTADFSGTLTVNEVTFPGPDGTGVPGASGINPRHYFSVSSNAADNDTSNNAFVLRLRLVAANSLENRSGRALPTTGYIQYVDPDSNTANGSTATTRTVRATNAALPATLREPTLQINQVLTSTSAPGGYDEGDDLAFTITISNGNLASDFKAFDITLQNLLSSALSNIVLQSVTYLGDATNNGGADFVISNNRLLTVNDADIDIGKGGSIELRVTATVNHNVASLGSSFDNDATVRWTSLDGPVSGERTGADGPLGSGVYNDYQRTSTLTIPVPNELVLSRVAGLPDTRAPSPTTASHEQVAVGEIIRYRATNLIPEGVKYDYVLQFTLDAGLDLLTDSIRLAFVSDGGITSTLVLTTGGTLNVSGNESSPLVTAIKADLSGDAPTGVLDPSRVQVTTVNGQQVVRLELGDIVNLNDNDADLEYLSVEFNVRVLNQASNTAGASLGVTAQSEVDGQSHLQSNTLYETVVESNFDGVDKRVIDFDPNPTGTSGTATVQLSMLQNGNSPAYDVHLQDSVTGGSQYTLLSLTLDGTSYGPSNLPAGITLSTTGGISLDFNQVEVNHDIVVVYQVTLPNSAAIAGTDATLTWSSLPETFTSWGGSTVGSDGSSAGERIGTGIGPNTYVRTDGAGLASVSGTVWNDTGSATASSTPDGNGLEGVTVTLTWAGDDGDLDTTDDNREFTTTTNAAGQYRFALLPHGLFRIETPTTVNNAEPLGDLNVRIDSDASSPLGRVQLTLAEGADEVAHFGYVEQNAAPINTLPGDLSAVEDTTLVISGLSISDADADRNPDTNQRQLTVTLDVLHGTLWLAANPQGAGVSGANSNALVLTGTQAQLNAALANLRYQGNLDYNGGDTLTVLTNDQSNYGDFDGNGIPGEAGDARSTLDTLNINVAAVNDSPVANNDTAAAQEAGGVSNQQAGENPSGNLLTNDTDVDIATNNDQLRVISAGRNGQAQQNISSGVTHTLAGLYGTLTLNSDGTYTYTVDNDNAQVQALRLAGQTLNEVFDYTVADLQGAQAVATLTITISGSNDAPVAVADTASATEAGGILNATPGSDPSGNVLANDRDADSVANGETMNVIGIRLGSESLLHAFTAVPASGTVSVVGRYGTLTIDAAGNYTYALDNDNTEVQRLVPGTTLVETFSYRIADTANAQDIAELVITINGAHDNPVASDDAAQAHAAASDDSNLESNPRGNLIRFPSRPGSITQPGGNGVDRDVDAPDQVDSALTVDGAINKTEASYNPLTDTLTTVTSTGTLITGQYGTLFLRSDGSYAYDVDSNNATVRALALNQTLTETFTYRLVDTSGRTDTAQLVITVHGVNDPPLAQNVVVEATEAGGLNNSVAGINPSGDATANDFDHDGDPLTITVARPGALADSGTDVAISSTGTLLAGLYGTLNLRADGTFTYTVDNSNPAVEALRLASDELIERFTYTLSDGQGGQSQAEIVVLIAGRNDSPVAHDDTAVATEAGGVLNTTPGVDATGNVLTNDTDVDGGEVASDLPHYNYGETQQVTSVRTGAESATGTSGTVGQELRGNYGWLTLHSDGSYSYRVDNSLAAVQALRTSANTLSDSFSYTVGDAAGAQDRATLSVTIQGANDAPVAANDTATAIEAGGVNNGTIGSNPSGNVLSNDSDVDGYGEVLRVTRVSHGSLTGVVGSAMAGTYGSLVLNADGSYSYTLDNSNAAVQALRSDTETLSDTFTYRVTDQAGDFSSAILTIVIRGRNDAPVASDDTGTAVEAGGTLNNQPGSIASGNVHSNDQDVDGNDALTLDGIRLGSEGDGGALLAVNGSRTVAGLYGTLVINADGTYTYTVNDSLAAVQALKVGETLVERFTYRIRDLAGATDTAQLAVTIQGAWDAPVAENDTAHAVADSFMGPGTDAQGNVLDNDHDVDGNDSQHVTGIRIGTENAGGPLTLVHNTAVVINGMYGQLIINPDGTYRYHVDANNPDVINLGALGVAREYFTYQVSDAGGLSDKAQLTILVRGRDHAPIAMDDHAVATDIRPGPHAQGNVLLNDTDPDFDPLVDDRVQVTAIRTGAELGSGVTGTVGEVIQGRYGSLVINANGSFSYIINRNDPQVLAAAGRGQVLQDLFTYTVSDVWGKSDQAQLTITLDIAAPFVPAKPGNPTIASAAPAHSGLSPVDPAVFIETVIARESSISELATWRSDGSRLDLVMSQHRDTGAEQRHEVAGQFVAAAVSQSSADSERGLAWILGRHGRVDLSADGLLSDPSVFAPLPVDLTPDKALPFYLQQQASADAHSPAADAQPAETFGNQERATALGFSAQLQAIAKRLPGNVTVAPAASPDN